MNNNGFDSVMIKDNSGITIKVNFAINPEFAFSSIKLENTDDMKIVVSDNTSEIRVKTDMEAASVKRFLMVEQLMIERYGPKYWEKY